MITNFVKFMKKWALKMLVFVMVTCTFAVTYMMSVKKTGWRKGYRDDWQSNMRCTGRESEGGSWAGSVFLLS